VKKSRRNKNKERKKIRESGDDRKWREKEVK